jgi:spermidine synthase
MDLWMTEFQTKNLGLSVRVKETLYTGRSEFQDIAVVDTEEFGRMLVLDGVFQTSIFDEFVYHEMIAHIPLFTHPNPQNVLVIGGGDGGSVREIVKHPSVQKVKMVEIDGAVVEASMKYLPEISEALVNKHPKLELMVGDGIHHVKEACDQYDVIIVDCSDPIGPGQGLFTPEFYQNVYRALKTDGLFVQQTESPFYHRSLIQRLYKDIGSLFPVTQLYLAQIPLYPGGTHCFTMGSKQYDPQTVDTTCFDDIGVTRYWNKELQKACFALPNYLQELIK